MRHFVPDSNLVAAITYELAKYPAQPKEIFGVWKNGRNLISKKPLQHQHKKRQEDKMDLAISRSIEKKANRLIFK